MATTGHDLSWTNSGLGKSEEIGLAKIQTKTKTWSKSMKTKFNDLQIFLNDYFSLIQV